MTAKDLIEIYEYSEENAKAYMNATTFEERQIIDIINISQKNVFAAKVARTIISNNFKSISAKQAEILNEYSVELIVPTSNCEDYFNAMIKKQKAVILA